MPISREMLLRGPRSVSRATRWRPCCRIYHLQAAGHCVFAAGSMLDPLTPRRSSQRPAPFTWWSLTTFPNTPSPHLHRGLHLRDRTLESLDEWLFMAAAVDLPYVLITVTVFHHRRPQLRHWVLTVSSRLGRVTNTNRPGLKKQPLQFLDGAWHVAQPCALRSAANDAFKKTQIPPWNLVIPRQEAGLSPEINRR